MDRDTDFKSQLEERIKRFLAQQKDLREQMVDFNHALNAIEKRLETAVQMYRLEFGVDPPAIGKVERSVSHRGSASRESWNDAIEAVLTEAGQPLHITDIWNRLQQRDFTTTAKDPLRAIAAVLVRHPNAVRTNPNTYALIGSNGSAPISHQQTLVPAEVGSSIDPREDT